MDPNVGIATCPEARDVDDDMELLLGALLDAGVGASAVDWSDATVDWEAFDLVVVRSTWDYARRRDEFVEWAERVGSVTRLANPAPVIRWNTDKHHLTDLAAAGVPVVPTTFVEPNPTIDADHVAAEILAAVPEQSGFVVKPTVSAGSKDTFRHAARTEDPDVLGAAAAQAIGILTSGRSVMLQPYLDGVDDEGESGLVFFDGVFSHAFRKGPMLRTGAGAVDGLFAPEAIEPRVATSEQIGIAAAAVSAARTVTCSELLYARVDLLPGPDRRPVVLELELTEPSFFLATDPASPARIAAAIASAAG